MSSSIITDASSSSVLSASLSTVPRIERIERSTGSKEPTYFNQSSKMLPKSCVRPQASWSDCLPNTCVGWPVCLPTHALTQAAPSQTATGAETSQPSSHLHLQWSPFLLLLSPLLLPFFPLSLFPPFAVGACEMCAEESSIIICEEEAACLFNVAVSMCEMCVDESSIVIPLTLAHLSLPTLAACRCRCMRNLCRRVVNMTMRRRSGIILFGQHSCRYMRDVCRIIVDLKKKRWHIDKPRWHVDKPRKASQPKFPMHSDSLQRSNSGLCCQIYDIDPC